MPSIAALPPPLQREQWTRRLSLDTALGDDADDEADLLTNQVANAVMEQGDQPVRRYSVGSSLRGNVLMELRAMQKSSMSETDLHQILDEKKHLKITELYANDLTDLAEESAFSGLGEESTRSAIADLNEDIGEPLISPTTARNTEANAKGTEFEQKTPTKERQMSRFKLSKAYTSGTSVFQHALYDLHATHQLDLHETLVRERKSKKRASFAEDVEKAQRMIGPADWLKERTRQRRVPGSSEVMNGDDYAEAFKNPKTHERKSSWEWADAYEAPANEIRDLMAQYAAQFAAAQHAPPIPPMPSGHSGEMLTHFLPNGQAMQPPAVVAQQQQQQAQMEAQMQQAQMESHMQLQQRQMQQMLEQMHMQQMYLVQMQQMAQVPQMTGVGMAPAMIPQMPQMPAMMPQMPQMPQMPSPTPDPPSRRTSLSPDRMQMGSAYAMALDQEGSLRLQRALLMMPPAKLQATIDELAPHLLELSKHMFGNYLVSKLSLVPQAQAALQSAFAGHVVEMAKHPQASRVLQAAFDHLNAPSVLELVAELKGRVAEVATATNGSWSVVSAFKHTHAAFLIEEVAVALFPLATHQHGTRVVQRMLPEAAANRVDARLVYEALLANGSMLRQLATDSYGNYVVQIALRSAPAELQAQLVGLMLPSLASFALTKGGCNVAEAAIENASAEQCQLAMQDLAEAGLNNYPFGKQVLAALQRRA